MIASFEIILKPLMKPKLCKSLLVRGQHRIKGKKREQVKTYDYERIRALCLWLLKSREIVPAANTNLLCFQKEIHDFYHH